MTIFQEFQAASKTAIAECQAWLEQCRSHARSIHSDLVQLTGWPHIVLLPEGANSDGFHFSLTLDFPGEWVSTIQPRPEAALRFQKFTWALIRVGQDFHVRLTEKVTVPFDLQKGSPMWSAMVAEIRAGFEEELDLRYARSQWGGLKAG